MQLHMCTWVWDAFPTCTHVEARGQVGFSVLSPPLYSLETGSLSGHEIGLQTGSSSHPLRSSPPLAHIHAHITGWLQKHMWVCQIYYPGAGYLNWGTYAWPVELVLHSMILCFWKKKIVKTKKEKLDDFNSKFT